MVRKNFSLKKIFGPNKIQLKNIFSSKKKFGPKKKLKVLPKLNTSKLSLVVVSIDDNDDAVCCFNPENFQ